MGVIVAQMSKISKVVRPGYHHTLRYKACMCQIVAVILLLLGTYRFLREQSALKGTSQRPSQSTLLITGAFCALVSLEIFPLPRSCINSRPSWSSVSWSCLLSILLWRELRFVAEKVGEFDSELEHLPRILGTLKSSSWFSLWSDSTTNSNKYHPLESIVQLGGPRLEFETKLICMPEHY